MNLSRDLKSLLVGFVMGMSQADREMLFSNASKVPEMSQFVSQKSVVKDLDFLSAIQAGQLTEQQLKWFYKVLDKMDEFHANGGALGKNPALLNEQTEFKKIDDHEPGFSHHLTFSNRLIENSLGSAPIPTLTILRESLRGVTRIEDYCTEVKIKKGFNKLMAEFYCTNYKNGGSNLTENVYNNLNGYELQNFTNIQAFNAVRSTATRNGIDHAYKVNSFHDIKKLDDGFVVKFLVEELS